MALSRAELLKKAVRRYTEVDGVRMQSLTELELSTLRGVWGKRFAGKEEMDMGLYALGQRELLAMVMVDDNGERLFKSTKDDLDTIGELPPEVFNSLANGAAKHVGLVTDQEVDRNEGKSETATA